MAIYHFNAKVIQRSQGRSAIAAAAYRAAEALHDETLGRTFNYLDKPGVVHSEILLPSHAPARWLDRAVLWNEAQQVERRKDAVLAREIELALPRELSQAEAIALARDFAREQFVARGMVADLNVHWGRSADGEAQPHAHIMLTMRRVVSSPEGHPEDGAFGLKERGWNDKALLLGWRARWAEMVNARLAEVGIDGQVDHRSNAARGRDLEPQNKIGPAGARRAHRGEDAERADEHRAIARRNGERLLAEPALVVQALTQQQSTFTRADLARLVHRHSDGAAQFAAIVAKVEAVPEVVQVGTDGRGRARYSTREMVDIERRLIETATALHQHTAHRVNDKRRLHVVNGPGRQLSTEQVLAYLHITRSRDLAVIVGIAGGGKSTMLGTAREVWEGQGYRVRGAALAGIAAEGLQGSSGIESRTIASWEHAWNQGREALGAQDVLVVDEAGMIGSRQLGRLMARVQQAGAKLVLVGDAEQLQAIEAGAAFRAIAERVGVMAITEPRRQLVDWQRLATKALASANTEAALDQYQAAGLVARHATREAARAGVIATWQQARQLYPAQSHLILAHERVDVRALNEAARAVRRAGGELGPDQVLETEAGALSFAEGDRVYFLRNERGLGGSGGRGGTPVKNGTLGTLTGIAGELLTVRLDDPEGAGSGAEVSFNLADYAAIGHGYAATIHKKQGATADQAHVLATPGMDRHMTYVALSRHRQTARLHWSEEDFVSVEQLRARLARERAKDTTLDYGEPDPVAAYAERRGLDPMAPVSEIVVPAAVVREEGVQEKAPAPQMPAVPGTDGHDAAAVRVSEDMAPQPRRPRDHVIDAAATTPPDVFLPPPALSFETPQPAAARKQLSDPVVPAALPLSQPDPLESALVRLLAVAEEVDRWIKRGLSPLPRHQDAATKAADALELLRPGFCRDLRTVLDREPSLYPAAPAHAAALHRLLDAVALEPEHQAAAVREEKARAEAQAQEKVLAPLRARLLDERMTAWWHDNPTRADYAARRWEGERVQAALATEIQAMPANQLRAHEQRWRQEDAAPRHRGSSPSPGGW